MTLRSLHYPPYQGIIPFMIFNFRQGAVSMDAIPVSSIMLLLDVNKLDQLQDQWDSSPVFSNIWKKAIDGKFAKMKTIDKAQQCVDMELINLFDFI